ncbi:MAG: hypothetical protein K6G47_09050 [Clostridia bacterium]|nr:hypothetical protein [Clostridia bacterium]
MKKLTRFISVFVAASMLLSLAACSDTKTKKSKDKDKEEEEEAGFSEKDAKSVAEDYVKALLAFDSTKAQDLSKEMSDDTVEYISDFQSYDDAKDVYDAWFKTFEYEINEDDIEIDDEEATVPVTVKYIKIDSLTVEDSSTDSWIAAINGAEPDSEIELNIEVEYDEDEEKALVSNADDVAMSFMDVADVYIYVSDFQYYDDALSGSWSKDEYKTTDSLEFTVEFSSIDQLDGTDIDLYVTDPNYDDVYTATIKYISGGSETYTFAPKDLGVDELTPGTYSIEFDSEFCYLYEDVTVVDGGSGTGNVGGGTDYTLTGDEFLPVDDECLGVYDDSTKVYTNEYFGFEYTLPEDMMYMDPAIMNINATPGLENIKVDYMGADSNGSIVMHIFGKLAMLEGADEATVSAFISQFMGDAGAEAVDGKTITYGNTKFIIYSRDEGEFMATIKESNVFIMVYRPAGDSSIEDLTSTLKGL